MGGDCPTDVAVDIVHRYRDIPLCGKCKSPVDVLKARVTGKKNGCWTCNKCACRYTQLHRQWGGWPPAEFESFSAEERKDFWLAIGACTKKEDQERCVLEKLGKKITETRMAGAGGKYLPLSVYGAKGFDTEAIRKGCTDKKPHPLFGEVYRVEIEYQNKETMEQKIREAILKSVQERQAPKGAFEGPQPKAKAKTKAKAEAKAKATPTIASKKNQADAIKVLTKTAALKFGMESAMANKKVGGIPHVHKVKMKSFIADLKKFEEAAQDTVSNQRPLKMEMSAVSEKCLEAQHHLSLFTGMLNSLG